ncbi:MAG: hypothetical protein R2912_03925 [Eubacteriales bacterium]
MSRIQRRHGVASSVYCLDEREDMLLGMSDAAHREICSRRMDETMRCFAR